MTLGELKKLVDGLLDETGPDSLVVLWPRGAWEHLGTCDAANREHDCGAVAWREFDGDDCTPTDAKVADNAPDPDFVILEFDRVDEPVSL